MCDYIDKGECSGKECTSKEADEYKPKYEESVVENCGVTCSAGWFCSREKGHEGDEHEAHVAGYAVARWK